jgi:hypothetical protein
VGVLRWMGDCPTNARGPTKQVSNDVLRWDNPFRKIDGQTRKGAVVENLSEEFDPGSD